MKTKTLNSILALSALGALTSTGCVFMFGAQNQIEFASESKIEQIAENIITKKDNENVIYETMTLKNGKKYHEAAFFKENRIYLLGILDEDNDGDRDKLIIYAKTAQNKKELLELLKDKKRFEIKKEDGRIYKLTNAQLFEFQDDNLDGFSNHTLGISYTLIQNDPQGGGPIAGQRIYNSEVTKASNFLKPKNEK